MGALSFVCESLESDCSEPSKLKCRCWQFIRMYVVVSTFLWPNNLQTYQTWKPNFDAWQVAWSFVALALSVGASGSCCQQQAVRHSPSDLEAWQGVQPTALSHLHTGRVRAGCRVGRFFQCWKMLKACEPLFFIPPFTFSVHKAA